MRISHLVNKFKKTIKPLEFDASYKIMPDGTETSIKIVQKNSTYRSDDSVGYSDENSVEYIVNSDYVDGLTLEVNNALVINGETWVISSIKPLRIGSHVIAYIFRAQV